jgi:hypothetical protein
VRLMATWASILVLSWLPMYGAELTIWWLFSLIWRGHSFGGPIQHFYFAAIYLVIAVMSALLGPIYPIAITLFYYDQRIRREGYDVVRMMESAGLNSTSTLQPAEAPMTQTNPEASEA